MVILIVSISLFLSSCKKPEPRLIAVGDARVVQKLKNGNFEVTPAFVKMTWELAFKVNKLGLELAKCREEKEMK